MTLQRAAYIALVLAPLVPGAARAQTLRLRVVDSASAPVVGALISAMGANDAPFDLSLTSPDGIAVLRVPAAGKYRVRVRRIGYTPFTSDTITVRGNTDPLVTITVPSFRVTLAAVRVTERLGCDSRVVSPSAESSPLWEEVRKALEASRISRTRTYVNTSMVLLERRYSESGRLEAADTTARGVSGARPFTAQDPATFERRGYVEGGYQTGLTFYGPDEEALLSAPFTRMHCVRLADSVRKAGGRTLVGLAFEPRSDNRLPEIQGTIWVDSATHELTRVEFTYVRAPLPVDVRGLGGSVEFARTSAGSWFVTAWSLRLPRWRPSNLERGGVRLAGYTEIGGAATLLREAEARRLVASADTAVPLAPSRAPTPVPTTPVPPPAPTPAPVAARPPVADTMGLARLLTSLPTVTVKERERVNFLRDEIGQRVRAGQGYITDSLKLAKLLHTWMAFQVPNATVSTSGPASWGVTVTRVAFSGQGMINCVPAVWLDDRRSDFEELSAIEKDRFALLEFYSRAANVPLKYGGSAAVSEFANWSAQQSVKSGTLPSGGGGSPRSNRASSDTTLTRGDCGVILAWTKAFLNVGAGKP